MVAYADEVHVDLPAAEVSYAGEEGAGLSCWDAVSFGGVGVGLPAKDADVSGNCCLDQDGTAFSGFEEYDSSGGADIELLGGGVGAGGLLLFGGDLGGLDDGVGYAGPGDGQGAFVGQAIAGCVG